jgi:hypothetical protein
MSHIKVVTRDSDAYEVSSEQSQRQENDGSHCQSPHDFVHLVRRHLKNKILCKAVGRRESMETHIEGVVDQVLADTSEHIQTAENVLHMVVHVRLTKRHTSGYAQIY